jgi:hypothetical protein
MPHLYRMRTSALVPTSLLSPIVKLIGPPNFFGIFGRTGHGGRMRTMAAGPPRVTGGEYRRPARATGEGSCAGRGSVTRSEAENGLSAP